MLRRKFLISLMAFTLIFTTIVPMGGASHITAPAPDPLDRAATAHIGSGQVAPGTTVRVVEAVPFYLDVHNSQQIFDYVRPTTDSSDSVLIDSLPDAVSPDPSSVTFRLPDGITTAHSSSNLHLRPVAFNGHDAKAYTIERVDLKWYAQCTLETGAVANVAMTATVRETSTNTIIEQRTVQQGTQVGGQNVATYEASLVVPEGKRTIPAGGSVSVTYALETLNARCTFLFGDKDTPSSVTLFSNTGRLNLWADNADGQPTVSLPTAEGTSAERRKFGVDVMYHSEWNHITNYGAAGNQLEGRLKTALDLCLLDGGDQVRWDEEATGTAKTDQEKILKQSGAKATMVSAAGGVQHIQYSFQSVATKEGTKTLMIEKDKGPYRFVAYGSTFQVPTKAIAFGSEGFTMAPVDGKLEHSINPGQRTQFTLAVTNTGSSPATMTLTSSGVTSGWRVDLINSRVSVQPGSTVEAVLFMEPPNGAAAGATGTVDIRAVSSIPDVPAQTVKLTTKLVSDATTAAKLTGSVPSFEVVPGQTVTIPGLRLTNDGSFEDTFTFSVTFPQNVRGWNGKADPSGATLVSGGSRDFNVQITAPGKDQAPDGLSFSATLQVKRLGGTDALETRSIPIKVEVNPAIEITAVSAPGVKAHAGLRNDANQPIAAQTGSVTLTGYTAGNNNAGVRDSTILYRLAVTNPRLLEETYDIDYSPSGAFRMKAADAGWSYKAGDQAGLSGAATQLGASSGTIKVGPGETKYHYVLVTDSRGDNSATGTGTLAVEFTSKTDRTVQTTFNLVAQRAGSVGAQGFIIEPEKGTGDVRFVKTERGAPASATGSGFDKVNYDFRVLQTSNAQQKLIIEIPSASGGWTHKLVARSPAALPDGGPSCNPCEGRRVEFSNVGPGDEVLLRLEVSGGSSVKLGDRLISNVVVRALSSPSVTEEKAFTTTAVGKFDFDARSLKATRTAAAGGTVALPFIIDNRGTEGDEFSLVVTAGSSDWRPRFSSDQQFFLAGETQQVGFLLVTVPSSAAVNDKQTFRIEVSSANAVGIKTVDATVTVRAAHSVSMGVPIQGSVELGKSVEVTRGNADVNDLRVVAPANRNDDITFHIDRNALPPGWTASFDKAKADGTFSTRLNNGGIDADLKIIIGAPSDALGTTKVPVLLRATCTTGGPATECAALDLVATVGKDAAVSTRYDETEPKPILAGGQARYTMIVKNEGLSRDTFDFEAQSLPTGYKTSFSPAQMNLDPLQEGTLEVLLIAPADAAAGSVVSFDVLVKSDDAFTVRELQAKVGFNAIDVTAETSTIKVAPSETATFTFTITNTGSLPDEVRVEATIADAALAEDATLKLSKDLVKVGLEEAVQVSLDITASANAPSANLAAEVVFTSLLNSQSQPVVVKRTATASVLDYVAQDIDGDKLLEYAVDRDGKRSNGFEEYVQSNEVGGKFTQKADLERFLSDKGRQMKVVSEDGKNVFRYVIDGDQDGKVDHFLDTTRDGLPNIYWDPDRRSGHFHEIDTFKDVNADGVADYFVDVDGDGRLDRVFDVVLGTFTNVLARDIDADGTLDYAVDANGNGKIDPNETVLFTRGGTLVTVLKVDVDGDGELDDVFDTDGDGRVDSFIRAGETEARSIRLRDVNNDGTLDWTYDSNLDGRMDSYYDPSNESGGNKIDTADNFADMVSKYWFVPAIFLLVIVLFIVLVVVTRR